MNYSHCLRSGTPVSSIDDSVWGTVVGVAFLAPAGLGPTYIVRLNSRNSESWKSYPYECAAIPRNLLRVRGSENIVARYEGEVQFYGGSQVVPVVAKTKDIVRQLYEPFSLRFSFKDDDEGGDRYTMSICIDNGLWKGQYEVSRDEIGASIFQGVLYHIIVEDRQGTLILNASMEEGKNPQHITLRAKCVSEKAEVEEDD